ncbi:hypothetical protein TSUD_159820 [Trifolium subterraneum]|uniref:Uncharacterized protein n=1 Tax=Trifolium subterraneum TaxID=3900 RepID=A0A2Z6M8Q6_TRISU|nr:hypothetical protein TSUD_159820 [Trifolium subterraneum]
MSIQDSDGIAKKNLRGVYEIEGENIVGVGYEKWKLQGNIPANVSEVARYKTIMMDVGNQLDCLLAIARNDDIFGRCFGSLSYN